jgi:hypothetical protein
MHGRMLEAELSRCEPICRFSATAIHDLADRLIHFRRQVEPQQQMNLLHRTRRSSWGSKMNKSSRLACESSHGAPPRCPPLAGGSFTLVPYAPPARGVPPRCPPLAGGSFTQAASGRQAGSCCRYASFASTPGPAGSIDRRTFPHKHLASRVADSPLRSPTRRRLETSTAATN